eukprot:jgi/Bigna1/90072/estExt_fgenesh1_pg.C_610102
MISTMLLFLSFQTSPTTEALSNEPNYEGMIGADLSAFQSNSSEQLNKVERPDSSTMTDDVSRSHERVGHEDTFPQIARPIPMGSKMNLAEHWSNYVENNLREVLDDNEGKMPEAWVLVMVILSIAVLTFVVYICFSPEYDTDREDDSVVKGYRTSSSEPRVVSNPIYGGSPDAAEQYTYVDVIFSVVAFMASSAGMAIANKMAVTAIKLPMLLVGMQSFFTLIVLIPFYNTIRLGSCYDRVRWAPVSVAFVAMLATSMLSYKTCSLGTVVVIRMISPLLGLLVELTFDNAKFVASPHTYGSLTVIMLGVVMYALFQNGIQGEITGIIFMMLNMFIATGERLAQRYFMAENPVDMSDTGLMLYNNVVCTLFMPLMMLVFNEWGKTDHVADVKPIGWVFITWSFFCGCCISYTAFRAQRRISATSFLVVVNMNKFVVVAFGIFVLKETYVPLAAAGCALTLLGGAYYSWDRSQLKKQRKDLLNKRLSLEEEEGQEDFLQSGGEVNVEKEGDDDIPSLVH